MDLVYFSIQIIKSQNWLKRREKLNVRLSTWLETKSDLEYRSEVIAQSTEQRNKEDVQNDREVRHMYEW